MAAQHALDALGARRVFILDWDVHHGDGTNDIFRASDAVLFASIHQAGIFPGHGAAARRGQPRGRGLLDQPAGAGGRRTRTRGSRCWSTSPCPPPWSSGRTWCSISAGYDAHRDDVQGGCELEAGSFAEMARHLRALGEQVGAPVGAVLEGGYALDALAASVAATLEALAGDEPPDMVAPDFLTTRAASYIGHHWTL